LSVGSSFATATFSSSAASQVVRDWLPEGEHAQDERIDLHLVVVDLTVERLDLDGPIVRAAPECLERELQAALAPRPHGKRVRAQLAQLRLEVTTGVDARHMYSACRSARGGSSAGRALSA
jgi:hypothetical protein